MNIYVGNLNYSVSEDELLNVFKQFGQVETVKIIRDRETGKPRGYAFVEMPDQQEATQAVESLNQAEVSGRKIKVNNALKSNESVKPEFIFKKNN